jgi:hypothetical protein
MIPAIIVGQQKGQRNLVPDEVAGKWGYADDSGNLVIAASFDQAETFSEGLGAIAVRIGPKPGDALIEQLTAPPIDRQFKWGFIDETGRIAVPPQYSGAGNFSEGMARVQIGEAFDGKWGYINASGEMVIEPQFYHAEDFKNGRAIVWKGKVESRFKRKHASVVEIRFKG